MQASAYVLAFTTDDSTGEENILHISARMPKQFLMNFLTVERW